MSTSTQTNHCKIDKVLTPEESLRIRDLFKQQNIEIPEDAFLGHVGERHGPDDCPYHASLGKETQYCIDQCYLQKFLNEKTEEASK